MGYSGKYRANDDTYVLGGQDSISGGECTVDFRQDGSLCIYYIEEGKTIEWVGVSIGVGHWQLSVPGTRDVAEMHQSSPHSPYIEGHCSDGGVSLMWRIKLPRPNERVQ